QQHHLDLRGFSTGAAVLRRMVTPSPWTFQLPDATASLRAATPYLGFGWSAECLPSFPCRQESFTWQQDAVSSRLAHRAQRPHRRRIERVLRRAVPFSSAKDVDSGVDTADSARLIGQMGHNACVGALGAFVAALLQSVSEPVLNRIAAKRMTLGQAIREVRPGDILRFFRTVLATNLLKFPFFEAVNTVTSSWTPVPIFLRAVAAAFIYTSAMLPLSNYRYMASLQMK
ncbi:unnamed protein product, partial [Polarella glacialis]